jgi:hypothetical protein
VVSLDSFFVIIDRTNSIGCDIPVKVSVAVSGAAITNELLVMDAQRVHSASISQSVGRAIGHTNYTAAVLISVVLFFALNTIRNKGENSQVTQRIDTHTNTCTCADAHTHTHTSAPLSLFYM